MRGGFSCTALLVSLAAFGPIGIAAPVPEGLHEATGPGEQLRRLQELRKRNGAGNLEYQNELQRAKADFGFGPKPPTRLSPQRPDSLKPAAVRLQLEPVRETQRHLATLGYLDTADVDGKLGPRTGDALTKFEKDHGLSATQTVLGPDHFALLSKPYVDSLLNLDDLKLNLSARYRLLDATGHPLFWGDDQSELALKLNQLRAGETGRSLYVEMQGFSGDKAAALATSLRIQQRRIDPSVSIGVIPHIGENRDIRQFLFTRGIKLEGTASRIERADSGADAGQFYSIVKFSVRVGEQLRTVTLWILAATADLVAEFLTRVNLRCPSDRFDGQRSLGELVAGVRKELKANHKGLTDGQLRLKFVQQFGNIDLGALRPALPFAWS